MVSYFVHYRGETSEAGPLVDYYRSHHVPILRRFPALRRLVLYEPLPWQDPFPIHPGNAVLIVYMVFDTLQDLTQALSSEPRALAREDARNFPPFRGSVTHQVLQGEDFLRGNGGKAEEKILWTEPPG